MDKKEQIERLKEIIKIAQKLSWILPVTKEVEKIRYTYGGKTYAPSYPLMQLSEVEKCMLAMVDDFDLSIYRKAAEQAEVATKTCGEVNREGENK